MHFVEVWLSYKPGLADGFGFALSWLDFEVDIGVMVVVISVSIRHVRLL